MNTPSLIKIKIKQWFELISYADTLFLYCISKSFYLAVRVYSDKAPLTSKHGKNKEVGYEPQASCVTDVRINNSNVRKMFVFLALPGYTLTNKWNLVVLYIVLFFSNFFDSWRHWFV